MFLGSHTSALKNKNRLSLPVPFGDQIADGVYVTQGFDRNLIVLTTGTFKEIYKRMTSLNIADPAARLLARMFLGSAGFLKMDKLGTIDLPKNLIEYARLNAKVVVVGQGDYFEVWSPDFWDKQQTEIKDADANAGRFSMFMIAAR